MSVKKLALLIILSAVLWCSLTIGADVPRGRLELKMVHVVSSAFVHVTKMKMFPPFLYQTFTFSYIYLNSII